MYQYMWLQEGAPDVPLEGGRPADWLGEEEVAAVGLSLWREHCLECAAPQCYGHCGNWVERKDRKCQKTYYGTKPLDAGGGFFAAQLKFRKWGKLETDIYPGMLPAKASRRLDRICRAGERAALLLSEPLKRISPTRKVCGAQAWMAARLFRKLGRREEPDGFLIQYYSPAEREYSLLVEFYTPEGAFYRNSMQVGRGYGQALMDVRGLDLRTEKGSRMRIYPESDVQEDIVFFCTDFVRLKHPGRRREAPAPKVKCVAWDLDNTVWDGILAEDGPGALSLRPGIREAMEGLDQRGIIQVAASKNDEENVLPQLERLGISHFFVGVFANWEPKSENLKRAAERLNIGLDTFALVDDSPFERGEVGENLPCVRVYPETAAAGLLALPEFDVPVTADGKKRRLMYQEEGKRESLRREFTGTGEEFLKSCGLEMAVEHVSEETFGRSLELLQRTNQLNLSGRKYGREELGRLCREHRGHAYAVHCRDKYGDYGQVGFFLVQEQGGSVVLAEYAMSCRVAGKWLEPALIKWLCGKYRGREVVFSGVDNEKNGLLIRTLKSFGLADAAAEPGALRLAVPAEKMLWPEVVTVVDRT